MMVYTKNLVLVCTGRDTARAAGQGMPVLHLCLGITPSGALQRLQYGGFSMISTSCDQSNAFWNSHSPDPAFVGQIHIYPERFRRNKGNASFHRLLRHAALPGEDRMVGNNSNQVSFGKLLTDIFLVICQKNSFFHIFGRKLFVI